MTARVRRKRKQKNARRPSAAVVARVKGASLEAVAKATLGYVVGTRRRRRLLAASLALFILYLLFQACKLVLEPGTSNVSFPPPR